MAEGVLDLRSLLVDLLIMSDFDFAVLFARDDSLGAIGLQFVTQGIGVISAVGKKAFAWPDQWQKFVHSTDIAVLATGQKESDWSPKEVGCGVDFRRASASRDANRLILRLFFDAPAAERWALT